MGRPPGKRHWGAQGAGDGPSPVATSVRDCFTMGPGPKVAPQAPMSVSPPSMGLALEPEPLPLADGGAPPGSHQGQAVAAEGAQPTFMNREDLVHLPVPCGCPVLAMEKKESLAYLKHAAYSRFKQSTKENNVSLLNANEGLPGIYSLCDCTPSTVRSGNGYANRAGQAVHSTSDAKSSTHASATSQPSLPDKSAHHQHLCSRFGVSYSYCRTTVCSQLASVIPRPNGTMSHEETRTYLRNATSFQFEHPTTLNSFGWFNLLLQKARTDLRNVTCPGCKQDTNTKNLENRGSLPSGNGISGPNPLSDCAASTKTAGNSNVSKIGQSMQSKNVAKNLTQLFVKVCGKQVSIQVDLNITTIKELIESACQKAGVHACDFFATYGGKPLKADKPIACYPIFKDSTVHVRPRLRAGRRIEYDCETFAELMSRNMGNRFHQVTLSKLSIDPNTQQNSVTFLSRFSAYYIHQIVAFICGKHRGGSSFNGQFTINDILIVNKMMVDIDSNVREFGFNEGTCSNDYAALYDIFTSIFIDDVNPMPMYFEHFLGYLFECPAKDRSNSEPLIRFLTYHPALTCYMDRIKQCNLLDNMVHRLDPVDKRNIDTASGTFVQWRTSAQKAPALSKVYFYDSWYNHKLGMIIPNAEYTDQGLGFLHFSRNYFNHADYQLKLEEAEAAFAGTMENVLPEMLLNIAKDYAAPADFDILTLLGNPLADSFTVT